MRLLFITGLVHVLALYYFPSKAIGQLTKNDTAFYQTSVKNALAVYHRSLYHPTGLFNGGQYVSYAHLIKDDHPYFQSDTLNRGTILHDSVLYENVYLMYDIVKQLVVIEDPYKIYRLSLINEKVNAFAVLNHTFLRLQPDSVNRNLIDTGFYDKLYEGKITLYEKVRKKMQEVIQGQELWHLIYPDNNFYLEIAGKFYSVNRKGLLLKLLKNRKKEIQQFIRKNKLDYRRDTENTLVKVITYYDGLPGK